jgi:hypothetical protein
MLICAGDAAAVGEEGGEGLLGVAECHHCHLMSTRWCRGLRQRQQEYSPEKLSDDFKCLLYAVLSEGILTGLKGPCLSLKTLSH